MIKTTTVTYCDRCRKPKVYKIIEIEHKLKVMKKNFSYSSVDTYDLCSDCLKDFSKWMMEIGNEGNR